MTAIIPPTSTELTEDVILRDGLTLRLRPPRLEDATALVRFFGDLSAESRHLRFHGGVNVDEATVGPMLDPDWAERGALIGSFATADGAEQVVALASYVRLRDPRTAEVAFAVDDAFQGRGVGTRLLERLAAHATSAGIARFVAEVLPANRAMLRVFEEAGFELSRELAGGVVEVGFALAPTEAYLTRTAERDHIAVAASLRPFFEPRSVAVVGASPRRGSIGGELFRNILASDFTGVAYPVNRTGAPVAGVRAYSSIDDLPEAPDLAIVCVPGDQVVDASSVALVRGVRALCVISAGFAETGEEGAARQNELLAAVRASGARLVGPNCLGIALSKTRLNATFGRLALPPGTIGFSSQSGALGLALLEKARERNLGFSAFVSIGNKADVSSNDLLEWWEDDPETEVVLLYLESFGNPRKFGRLAKRVARSKPIVALKAGTTVAGARAASSHTAALAGSDAAVDALFRESGVIRARTLEELIDASVLFSSQPLPRGRNVAVVTNAGGLGILCADACDAAGLALPELGQETQAALAAILPAEATRSNPVDLLGSATGETYEAVVPLLLADPRVDALIVLFVPPVVAGADEVSAAILRAVEQTHSGKPVLATVLSADGTPAVLRSAGSRLATFPYPESAARALGLAADRADWLRRPAGRIRTLDGIDVDAARALIRTATADAEDVWLDPEQTRALLISYGVRVVPQALAATVAEAVSAATELGFPVAVKSSVAGAHKTEQGGIALRLGDAADVAAAAARVGLPVIVQPMIEGGVELLAGVAQDPVFGPLVAFAPGGVLAELIGGANFRVAPLTDVDAEELVRDGKAGQLVRGFRGAPPADVPALAELLERLGCLAEDLPEVVELDLNPVIARGDGCVAVDARIRVRVREATWALKSW
jgi:acetyl coenzyme A synthetase (ADP forming)-like protein